MPIPRSRYMDDPRPGLARAELPDRRALQHRLCRRRRPAALGATASYALAELVADLLEPTGLVPADRLAAARGRPAAARSRRRSSTRASPRPRASPARSPSATTCPSSTPSTSRPRPTQSTRSRCTCSSGPWRSRTGRGRTCSGSPSPIPPTSRRSTSSGSRPGYTLELAVATRDDLLAEIKRFSRASEAIGARDSVDLDEFESSTSDGGGRSRGRRRRLRRAARPARQLDHLPGGRGRRQRRPFRAAGGCLLVRFRIDGVLQEVQRIPKRLATASPRA